MLDQYEANEGLNPSPMITSFGKMLINIFHTPPRCKYVPGDWLVIITGSVPLVLMRLTQVNKIYNYYFNYLV